MRDFIYVKDAVKMSCAFLKNELCGIFNIGRGKPTTWNELASALFKALQKEPKIEYVDMPVQLAKQYQNFTCANMDKLHKIIPFGTESMESAVLEYVQQHLMRNARW
jgi:ADP-L-glycero-D-manno-heptose 6-epimerase